MRQPAAFRPSRYFSTVDEISKPVNAAVVLFASWPYRFPLAVASASRGNRPRGRRCRSPSFQRQIVGPVCRALDDKFPPPARLAVAAPRQQGADGPQDGGTIDAGNPPEPHWPSSPRRGLPWHRRPLLVANLRHPCRYRQRHVSSAYRRVTWPVMTVRYSRRGRRTCNGWGRRYR